MKKLGWKSLPIGCVAFVPAAEYKTGSWRSFKPVIDQEKCVKCLTCWVYCPDVAIIWTGEEVQVNYDYCKGCGICAKECPYNAIQMVKEG